MKLATFFMPSNSFLIIRVKVAGATFRPNGMTFHWKSPMGVVKAVTSLIRSDILICQYPLLRSVFEKYLFACEDIVANRSSMLGMASMSGLVTLLRRR